MKTLNQSSSGKKKVLIFALILLALTLADIILTRIGTPDLSNDANILVTVIGLGWKSVITVNIILYILYIILIYIAFVRYKHSIVQCDGFKQFLSMIYYDHPDWFKWIWIKYPKKGRYIYLLAPLGYSLAITLPIIRLFVVTLWIGRLSGSNLYLSYSKIIRTAMNQNLLMIIIVLIALLFLMVYWYYKEYKINKKALEELKATSIFP